MVEGLGKKSDECPEDNKTFCSTTIYDIKSMIIGFKQLCELPIQGNKINTDVVENIFSQVRARNGQNDNPRLAEYGKLYYILY